MAQGRISLNPDSFVDVGRINNQWVVVTNAQFTTFDYGGKADPQVCLELTLQHIDEASGKTTGETVQYWKVAKPGYVVFNEDEPFHLMPGDKGQLLRNTNFFYFVDRLVQEHRMPKDFLDGDDGIKALVGLEFLALETKIPTTGTGRDGKEIDQKPILAKDVAARPWDPKERSILKKGGVAAGTKATAGKAAAGGAAAPAAAGKKAAPAAAAAEVSDEDIDAMAVEIVKATVLAKGGEDKMLPLAKLKTLAITLANQKYGTHRAAITAKLANAEWLNARAENEGDWLWDGDAQTVQVIE